MSSSLRRQLLAWVLLPLACAVAVDTWLTYRSSVNIASVVQDRLLLGSARMIAEQLSFQNGAFEHEIPPAALELFQSQSADRIYYRVTTGAGHLLAGYTDLPLPKPEVLPDVPHFFAAAMRGEAVRVVAYFQPVIGNPSALPVVVQVAQTMRGREQLTNQLWMQAVGQQLLILALTSICILFGLHLGLRPLIRLRNDVRARKEGSLKPLQTDGVPAELMPLVEAFNDYIARLENHTNQRGIFIQNVAHQLRTPLTVLTTQISDALRASDKPAADAPLLAARRTLQQTARLVNQFLSLSSAQTFVASRKPMSTQACCEVIQTVLEDLAPQAHNKNIDLGFERTGGEVVIRTDALALREIAVNIIDNAIRYTSLGGTVTVRVESGAGKLVLAVEDNGPGVAPESRDKIFERFFRVEGSQAGGSGLGLAIVRELVDQCGGAIRVEAPRHGGHGLLLRVEFATA
jgi:two-component system, OmpR family, sensor histidine kinase TctE